MITGAGGFIGQHLREALAKANPDDELIPVGSPRTVDSRLFKIDLGEKVALENLICERQPTHIVHLAGNKNLGYCERNADEVRPINLESTETICAAMPKDCRLIFLSSDYVFDGERGNYAETDEPAPGTVYGRMKFESERMIQKSCDRYTIIRTGGVYGVGGRFFDWILDSLKGDGRVEAFVDTRFTPTYIGDLLRVILSVLDADDNALYHVAGPVSVSRYEMACAVARTLGEDESRVDRSSVADSGMLIPADNSLNSDWTRKRLAETFTGVVEGIPLVLGN
ncbi:MAG: SDR family oxidoreductase, partial [Leptospirales bacterium]|jgi:dTDP-4-dehydrorhamnose reductase